jgi:hypothetical protein
VDARGAGQDRPTRAARPSLIACGWQFWRRRQGY